MISIPYTIIHEVAMVIKTFYTFPANLAMDTSIWPKPSTEKAEVLKISIFLDSFIKNFIELLIRYAVSIAWISFGNNCKKNHSNNEE